MMGEGRQQSDNSDPQIDEAVWNAWVKKNAAKDEIRFARRKKMFGILVVLAVVVALVWRFTR